MVTHSKRRTAATATNEAREGEGYKENSLEKLNEEGYNMSGPNAEDRNNRPNQIQSLLKMPNENSYQELGLDKLDKVGLEKGMNGTETELYQPSEMGQFKTTNGDSRGDDLKPQTREQDKSNSTLLEKEGVEREREGNKKKKQKKREMQL